MEGVSFGYLQNRQRRGDDGGVGGGGGGGGGDNGLFQGKCRDVLSPNSSVVDSSTCIRSSIRSSLLFDVLGSDLRGGHT